ncbi:MAG: hypothetical protein K2N13_03310 [Paraprevotella sp.]|nr:hypothetical protein [Paraprevotella sp.]
MAKRLLIITALLGLAIYFIFAITVLNKPKDELVCNDVFISVTDSMRTNFINESDIRGILTKAKKFPEGKKMKDIDLLDIEQTLAQAPFVQNVRCYKTATGKICIQVLPHQPVLHIMSDNGENYYLDNSGRPMPSKGYYADLVVATGHITKEYARKSLTALGRLIQHDAFWNNQIQQIHVLSDGTIELTPKVGEHTIFLGQPRKYKEKLNRMRTFYTEGLNKVGWNKYSTISLEYDNQIICKKNKK